MTSAVGGIDLRQRLLGRTFMHPVLDYLFVASVISLFFTAWLLATPFDRESIDLALIAAIVLLANSTHFASSTVRLYTIRESAATWPVLTMIFPLIALGVVTLCIVDSERLGPHLQALYLTWSPFHFARQGYGLAVMYGYRSGCRFEERDKRLLHQAALIPFYYMVIVGAGAGIDWLLPRSVLDTPIVMGVRELALTTGPWLAFGAPLLVFAKIWRSRSGPMPLISLLCILTTTTWFIVLHPLQAFVWATIFHGIQYLVVIVVFHVKERMAEPDNRRSATQHALGFYAMTLVLAYLLFHALPWSFAWVGMGFVEAKLAVIAGINLHHFIVDGFIWKFKAGGANRRIVEQGVPAIA